MKVHKLVANPFNEVLLFDDDGGYFPNISGDWSESGFTKWKIDLKTETFHHLWKEAVEKQRKLSTTRLFNMLYPMVELK